jgi:hypothetical protein
MWRQLLEARMRNAFYDALNTLISAGCDEDAVFEAGVSALDDLLVKMVKQATGEGRKGF